jgi:predicted transcriptional regulator
MDRILRITTEADGPHDADEGVTTLTVPRPALPRVLAPTNLDLLRAIRTEEPDSIRETAAAVDRDVKNVHENLMELSRLGVVEFEWDGRARRPVVDYDAVSVSVSLLDP